MQQYYKESVLYPTLMQAHKHSGFVCAGEQVGLCSGSLNINKRAADRNTEE